MTSKRIQNLWIDNNQPPQTNVVWIRPNCGIYYYDNGRWIPILGNRCVLKEDLISGIDLGGVHSQQLFEAGSSIEELLRILLTTHNSYTITVSTTTSSYGTVSGGGTYIYGNTCTITATPYNGYKFVRWTKNGSQVSTNPSHTFTVTEDATYTAVFASDTSIPTVTTANVSNITQNTATCGGNITSDGNSTVTARGVCWSTSSNPTIEDNHTSDGTGTGSFTSNITGLTLNTTYRVRAYATNSVGTAYGDDKEFKTDDYPDYYIGFYKDPEDYLNASNDDLIDNARVSSTVAKDPNYPSSDSDDYIYYQNNEKMMYLIYNVNYTVQIDTDNPGGDAFDQTDRSVEEIHMPIFNRNQITKNNKTYSILATYNPGNTSENGYRFKFSNN